MRYALLICTDESAQLALSPEEGAAMHAEYEAFGAEMGARGVLAGGERLHPTTDATSVRVRDGETLTSDGPFAETKEQIGGILVLEARDMEHAVELMSKHPALKFGSIFEIRPVGDMSKIIEASEKRRQKTSR